MKKIAWIAWRDFLSTITTKGFIIGLLVMPTIIGIMIVVMPILMNDAPPDVKGEVAILDPTGQLAEPVRKYLTPEAIAMRRDEFRERIEKESPEAFKKLMEHSGSSVADDMIKAALGGVPDIQAPVVGQDS